LWSDLPTPWNLRAAAPELLPAFNKSAAIQIVVPKVEGDCTGQQMGSNRCP